MKFKTLFLVGTISTCFTPMAAQAQAQPNPFPLYDNLFVVGDSIADDGNLKNYGVLDFPPSELGYNDGRFTNGLTFTEYLHDLDSLIPQSPELFSSPYDSTNNVAVGGSGSGNFHVIPELSGFAGLNQQVQRIAPFLTDRDLVIMVSGTNDYFFNQDLFQGLADPSADPVAVLSGVVDTVVGNITANVQALKEAGAKNVLVFGQADLSLTPVAADFATNYPQLANGGATFLATAHNNLLENALDQLSEDHDINATFFDFNQWLAGAVDAAPLFGITRPTEACVDVDIVQFAVGNDSVSGSCLSDPDANPAEYGFFDETHPSAGAHQLLAGSVGLFLVEEAQKNMGDETAVPEPLTILGAGAAIGFGGLFKRKLAKAGKNS